MAVRPTAVSTPKGPHQGPGRSDPARGPSAVASDWLATRSAAPTTLDEGLKRLGTLADRLHAANDRRAIFASTYLIQIQAFAEDVRKPDSYQHPAWMETMVLDFLQRYLDAFDAYERKDFAHVPAAWKVAFDRAVAADGPVMGDLLLAMNAHINHDLPITLAATRAGPSVKADYLRFNDVLEANIGGVQDLVANRFLKPGSLAARGDRWLGPLDEAATDMTIRRWRDAAWTNGQRALANGRDAYPAIRQRADWRAKVLGSGIQLLPDLLARRGLL
jgi:hypothetical protein